MDIILYEENSIVNHPAFLPCMIVLGFIVFGGVEVILLLYCLGCWRPDKTSETLVYIQKKYKFKPINPITPEQRVVHNENSALN